jgi:hypothetical protein
MRSKANLASGQQLANRNPAGTLAKVPDARQGLVDLFLAPVGLGHDPGDAAPVPGNNQRCAPLHFVQELRKMNFGFRGLNFAHRINQSIRPVLLYHFASQAAAIAAPKYIKEIKRSAYMANGCIINRGKKLNPDLILHG